MAVKKAPDRTRGKHGAMLPPEELGELNQRDVHLLVDRTQDDVAVSLDAMGALVSALALRTDAPGFPPLTHPADRARNPNPEPLCRRTPR
jgi:hypothetical protein